MAIPYTIQHLKGDDINEQWLQARKKGLGGSDVAAILGLSPWKSAYDLWMEKTGRVETPDISDKPSVEWGTILEDEIAKKFAKEHSDIKVSKLNAILTSKEKPWMLASLDRRLRNKNGESGILEIKTASIYSAKSWDNGVPDYYKAQIAHYLYVTGWNYVFVAVLIGGQDYREYYFTKNDLQSFIDRILTEGEDFWYNYILSDICPPMTGLESESATLLAGNPLDDSAPNAPATKTFDELVEEYQSLHSTIADLKQKESAVSNEIKNLIGTNPGMESNNYVVTWTRSERSTFDRKRFEKDHPGLTNDYYKVSPVNGTLNIKTK